MPSTLVRSRLCGSSLKLGTLSRTGAGLASDCCALSPKVEAQANNATAVAQKTRVDGRNEYESIRIFEDSEVLPIEKRYCLNR